jgi:hypothetical protein
MTHASTLHSINFTLVHVAHMARDLIVLQPLPNPLSVSVDEFRRLELEQAALKIQVIFTVAILVAVPLLFKRLLRDACAKNKPFLSIKRP